jgi:hypothetical protein
VLKRVHVALSLLLVAAPLAALPPPPPVHRLLGEVLEFEVRWGVIPVAHATMEIHAARHKGQAITRVMARSLPLIDAFYPVRDRIEAKVWLPNLRPMTYKRLAKEGHGPVDEEVLIFNHHDGVVQKFSSGKARPYLAIPDTVFDPLTCFFAYRTTAVHGSETVRIPVTDGRRVVRSEVRVLRRERLKTPAGTFDTVVVEPDLEGVGGIFRRSKNAHVWIWLTDDEWRRPVKLQSAVAVGHFSAVLTAVRWESGGADQKGSGSPADVARSR